MSEFIQIQNLEVAFPIHGGVFGRQVGAVRAVNGVSLEIKKGERMDLKVIRGAG